MQHYKKLMSLTVGLLFAILSGGLSSDFIVLSDWFRTLPLPWFTPPTWVFPLVWLGLYLLTAILIADAIATIQLRKYVLLWVMLTLMQPLWCFIFFTLHFLLLSLILLVVIFCLQLFVLAKMLKEQKGSAFLALPLVLWYMYLITVVYGTILAL